MSIKCPSVGLYVEMQQVLANKDASPFLCCFVVVIVVVVVDMVVVVAVVWLHMDIVYHTFSISRSRGRIKFLQI